MVGNKVVLVIWAAVLATSSCSVLEKNSQSLEVDVTGLKARAAGIDLTLDDLPEQFTEYDPMNGRMVGGEGLFEVQSEFSFRSEQENPLTITGMTTVYPYIQREYSLESDRVRSQMELIIRSITKGYTIGRDVEVEELFLSYPVGDAYTGRTFNESLAYLGYPEYHTRTQILIFERNAISVILLFQYVEELPRPISLEDVAQLLDQRIRMLESLGVNSEN